MITTIALDRTVPYLRDGMNVDVDIVTQNLPHVLVLSADAVRRDDKNRPYVLVVADGTTVKRSVVLGATNDAQVVVRSGIAPSDTVVADRNIGIVEGMHVSPTALPSASPSPKP